MLFFVKRFEGNMMTIETKTNNEEDNDDVDEKTNNDEDNDDNDDTNYNK